MPDAPRVGLGFDAHRFGGPGPVIVGGVEFPSDRGVEADSDGDVLTHALCDALLGAAAMGDLGLHFSRESVELGISSLSMLESVVALVKSKGMRVVNADTTLICVHPRISDRRGEIQTSLAWVLEVDPAAVGVKATTTDGMGFAGEEGIAAIAVVLLAPEDL